MKKHIYIIYFFFFLFVGLISSEVNAQKKPVPNAFCTPHLVVSSSTSVTCKGGNDGAATVVGYTTGTTCTQAGVNDLFDGDYYWDPPLNVFARTVTGVSAGDYTVTWNDPDGDCPAKTITVTITEPSVALGASTSINNATCGQCNGTVDIVFVSGGTGAYSYLWTPGNFTSSGVGNRCPSTMNCTVSDANGCNIVKTCPVINVGTATNSSIPSHTDVTCSGANNGTATANATGGGGSYTYAWAPSGGTGQIATGLAAGTTYTLTVTGVNGCVDPSPPTISVTQPMAIGYTTINSTAETCGKGNGSAVINGVGGGTPAFSYVWSPYGGSSSGGFSSTASGLSSGNFSVTITDSQGCTKVVAAPPVNNVGAPINANTTVNKNVSCKGGSDGSATAYASNGQAPLTFFWQPPVSGFGQTMNALPAGTYNIDVTDGLGCTGTTAVTITEPFSALSINPTSTPASCGVANGTAYANEAGGSPPYTYQWSPSGGIGPVANNLLAGAYTITIWDNNGCTLSKNVSVNSSGGINANVTVTSNVSCFGGNNGAANVTASSGTLPYTYAWSPSGGSTSVATGLIAGTSYAVQVTDFAGCVITKTFSITQPSAITAAPSTTQTPCTQSTGSATANASGGSPTFTYLWKPGNQTTSTATGLAAGNYTVTVTDSKNCTKNFTALVTNTGGPTVNTALTTNISCFGGSNGVATATVTPASSYTFSWNTTPVQTTASATGLSAGNYMVTVTSTSGCVTTSTVQVTQPTQVLPNVVNNSVSICKGAQAALGSNPSGGSPGYTFNWVPGADLDDGTLAHPTAGCIVTTVYTVTVTDSKSCTAQATVTVTVKPLPTVNAGVDKTICTGGNATLIATGASTYTWSPTSGLSNPNISNPVANPSATTFYIVTGTNSSGCTNSDTVKVSTGGAAPVVSISAVSTTICAGLGNTTLTASTGNAISYSWTSTPPTFPPLPNTNTVVVSPDQVGTATYTVVVTNAGGCTGQSVITLTVTPSPTTPTVAPGSASVCLGDVFPAFSTTPTPPNYVVWTDPANSFFSVGNTYQPPVKPVGSYTLVCVQGTAASCLSYPAIIPLIVHPLPVTNAGLNMTVCPGFTANLNASSTGGGSPYSYLWSPTKWLNNASLANPSSNPDSTIIYLVTVTDANNCKDKDSVTIFVAVNDTCTLSIYNLISPNGDNKNEVWWIDGITGFRNNTVHLFNRWGSSVWFGQNYDNDKVLWKGQNDNGEKLPDGTYYYVIELGKKTLTGFVELIH